MATRTTRFIAGTALALALLAGFFAPGQAEAFNAVSVARNFNAGRIIDDAVFTDDGTMSASQIQNFLEQQMPASECADKQHSGQDGDPPCLRYPLNSDGKLASRIIYDAARENDINPQVLLATLQKETGLITNQDPAAWRYRTAMGYGCPDTADCDADYFGFENQMDNAARQFRRYIESDEFNYETGDHFILYNPNTDCGGSTVNIRNQATSALYNYTPYQPNSAAKNAGFGTGNSCSAYGNRNFWLYFNQWFGSPLNPEYRSEDYERCCHYSATPGTTRSVTLYFKNTSNTSWWDESGYTSPSAPAGTRKVMLFTGKDLGRDSRFATRAWGAGDNIPGRNFSNVWIKTNAACSTTTRTIQGATHCLSTSEHRVRPGEIAQYTFNMTIPMDTPPDEYREYFQLSLFQKPTAFKDPPASFINVTVRKPVYKAEVYRRCCHDSAVASQSSGGEIWLKNTGNMPWYDNSGVSSAPNGTRKVTLFTDEPSPLGRQWGPSRDKPGQEFAAVYESDGTTPSGNNNKVNPGEIAKFTFEQVTEFNQPSGKVRTYFQPELFRRMGTFNDIDAFLDVNVTAARLRGEILGRTYSRTIAPGERATVSMRVKNTGNVSWYDVAGDNDADPGYPYVVAATARPTLRSSRFGWPWTGDDNMPGRFYAEVRDGSGNLTPNQHRVKPNEIVTLIWDFKVPPSQREGTYYEYIQLIGREKVNGRWVNRAVSGTETRFRVIVRD